MRRSRDLIEILDDHERSIRRLQQSLARAGIVLDHGGLNGLSDDDHALYHTDARGDLRYLQLTGGTLTGELVLDQGGTAQATINMGDVDGSDDGAYWHNTKRASDHGSANHLVFSEYNGTSWSGWLHVEPGGDVVFDRAQVHFQNGAVGAPSIGFANATTTGFYKLSTSDIGVTRAGTLAWRFANPHITTYSIRPSVSTTLALGDWTYRWASVTSVRFLVSNSASAAAPDYSFANSLDAGVYLSGADEVGIAANGSKVASFGSGTGVYLPGAYALTTSDAVNVRITSGGFLKRSTSARKYKRRINYNVDYLADLELKPVKFYAPGDKKWYLGFIADDLAEEHPLIGEFEDGEIENYDIRAVVAVLAAKVKRLESERT